MASADRIITRHAALKVATEFLEEHFPEAEFAFAAGSIMRGMATPSSDIDLVVIHAHLPAAYRASSMYQGIPIEAFIHDETTLEWFFDADAIAGRPVLARMVVEGTIVGSRSGAAQRLRTMAADILKKGPPPLDCGTLDRLRYGISDMLTDLRDDRPLAEKIAIGATLYTALGDFILRSNGRWTGSGKWLPRELAAFDPSVGQAFISAFETLFRSGETRLLLAFATEVFKSYGGPLFEGYRSVAPVEWRKI